MDTLYFRLVLEKQEKFDGHQQFFAIVQLIGTRKQAENFAYRSVSPSPFREHLQRGKALSTVDLLHNLILVLIKRSTVVSISRK
jgi:Seven in absentia protein family